MISLLLQILVTKYKGLTQHYRIYKKSLKYYQEINLNKEYKSKSYK